MVVTHVAIKKTEGGYNIVSIEHFISLSLQKRTELLIEKRIRFLDELGGSVSLLEGVKYVGSQVKARLGV